jgi:hypothetical protein
LTFGGADLIQKSGRFFVTCNFIPNSRLQKSKMPKEKNMPGRAARSERTEIGADRCMQVLAAPAFNIKLLLKQGEIGLMNSIKRSSRRRRGTAIGGVTQSSATPLLNGP